MKNLLLIVLLLIPTPGFSNPYATNTLSTKINNLLKDFGDTVSIGIQVTDPKTGKVLYHKNADHYFMPASNEKLFTATAALASLNENFTYKTQLFANVSKINNGILNDNIYLKFSGDPTLTLAQLDNLINALTQAGVRKITGNIVIDDSAFDQMSMSPGSTWDDKDYCWGAPIHAIIVEGNCVKATLNPAASIEQPAVISLPAYPQSIQFINNAITRAPDITDCVAEAKRTSPTNYTIDGCITKAKDIEMAIDNPRSNIQFLLTYLLNKHQIITTNSFEFKKIELPTTLLATAESPSLNNLVTKMLKESDNTIANSLFKTMGSIYAKDTGSFQNGGDAVRNIVNTTIPLDIPKTTLIDGSGESRYDFLKPQQIVTLLQKMYASNQAVFFIHALPIGGIDGTLKERMKDPATVGKVYAKTGSETAVSTLSGYLETKKKNTLIFSIMINGFVDTPKKYQDLEDKICAAIIEAT